LLEVIDKQVKTTADAVAGVRDGSTVLVAGFGAVGVADNLLDALFAPSPPRHCEPTGRANARPMTGSAKQSRATSKTGLLRRKRSSQ
jgi:hypothetical protein